MSLSDKRSLNFWSDSAIKWGDHRDNYERQANSEKDPEQARNLREDRNRCHGNGKRASKMLNRYIED